jgi:DNA-binding NarL/FixJ family response regulator
MTDKDDERLRRRLARRKYRQANKELVNKRQRERRAAAGEKGRAAARAYYQKNIEKMRERCRQSYYKHKPKKLASMISYAKAHRKVINEQARVRIQKNKGLPPTPKSFSFHRDFIINLMLLPFDRTSRIWEYIISLPLSRKRRELIKMTLDGYTTTNIAAIRGILENTISKTWNGNTVYHETGKSRAGGIYKKFLKHLNFELRNLITELGLKYEQ